MAVYDNKAADELAPCRMLASSSARPLIVPVLRSSIRLALSLGASGALRHPCLRNFSTIGGELEHDLLVEPNIHFR